MVEVTAKPSRITPEQRMAETSCMRLNLFISGRKLRDLDTVTKSDPQCLLLEWKEDAWVKIGHTE